MPYNIDGSISKHARNVEKFAKVLEKYTPLPIILYDERLSTAEAIFAIDEFDYDGDVDTEAARIILINFLEGK
jgi:putative transcription antitermination factor YqgF